MKKLKRISVFLLAICMLFSVTSVLASAEGYDFTFEIQGREVYSEIYDVLELVNEYRADEGLAALTLDAELTEAAMQRAAECTIFFDHTRPNGESCFTVFPDRLGGRRAENIAIGQRNAAEVMDSWMTSSGHHANIMDSSSRSIGIGCFYHPDGTYSWVQLFSSTTAIPPSSTLQNRNTTATIEAVGGLLGLACALEETSTPDHFELRVYNLNIEFPYYYIPLTSNNIYFTSSNSNVCRITNKTHLEYTGEGTAIISGYFGNTLFFQTEHEVGDPAPHEHSYTPVVTAPTCTSEGYTTYTCSCGDSYISNRVNALGHSYSSVVTAPTCTTGGYTTHTCRNCGSSYVDNRVSALGHSYSSVVTAPTCTAGGYTTYTCRNCGNSYISNRTSTIPHDYTVTVIPNGYLYECNNCDHSYTETVAPPETLLGDANGDGVVSNSDLIAIARYVVGLSVNIDLTAADYNESGDITNADIIAVARYIVGIE